MPGGISADDFLMHARAIVGQREASHGAFVETHGRIAKLWSAYLSIRRDASQQLDAADVLTMLELVKVAREHSGGFNPDDSLDRIGYAAGAAEVRAKMALAGYFGDQARARMVAFLSDGGERE